MENSGTDSVYVLDFLQRQNIHVLVMLPLAAIVLFCKVHVAQKFGVHAFGTNVLASLGLFDAVGVRLLCVVVCASVLGLCNGSNESERKDLLAIVFHNTQCVAMHSPAK
jgi:hypothetical protein